MESNDPLMLVAAVSIVSALLASIASRLIGAATSGLSAEFDEGGYDRDLSRVRERNRRG